MDPLFLRQIIMDHYENPRNHHLVDNNDYKMIHMASESCIDDIKVQVQFEDNKIKDICFDGIACTISTASTSIMSELLRNKTLDQAKVIIEEYYKMIDLQEYDENLLEEAIAFQGVGKQANRIKCATIGWKAIEQMIEEKEKEHGK